MACTSYTLKGMAQECKGSVAGLKKLYIGLIDDISGVTTTSAQTISAFSLKAGKKLYDYFVTEESSSLTSTLTKNSQNGVKYYNNVINATFVKMTPEKHLELQALANEKTFCIAVDNNGYSWFLGADSFVTATEETAQSGQSFDDLSGYQVVLTHRSGSLPYSIAENLYSSDIVVPTPTE